MSKLEDELDRISDMYTQFNITAGKILDRIKFIQTCYDSLEIRVSDLEEQRGERTVGFTPDWEPEGGETEQ